MSSSRASRCSGPSARRWRPSGSRRRSTWSPRCTAAACRPRPAPCATASPAPWSMPTPTCAPSSSGAASSRATRASRNARRPASRRPASGPSSRSASGLARTLFGTDGVRGVAGEFVTAELALALARAATERLDADAPRVLVVRDTRASGEMLEAAVAAGAAAAGGEVLLGGVLPTPGAPLLLARHGLDLGVVLSASHNPYRDNGIKFFGGDGFKLSDETEHEIEAALDAPP